MLKIYNTLTKRKEEFRPLNYPVVNMYTCGVTVYDDCHLGHGRSVYIFETIRKFLIHKGYKVKLVRNITDVDDKIIAKAREWSKNKGLSLKEAFDDVRKHYIENYHDDLDAFAIPAADIEPLATENITEMINFIEGLINKGFAYNRGGSVYFSIRKFHDYGRLSGRKVDDLFSGVRIEPDSAKADPLDFALWKKKKEDEPFWFSPFGEGRPGWHIECSVMANKYLGNTLDIHGGGKDLVFPHHENEIAQSQALWGKKFARYWVHHGLLTINNQKMSKSSGNFITLKEAINKYSSTILKLIYLTAHYRTSLDFSENKIKEAQKLWERIRTFIGQLGARLHMNFDKDVLSSAVERKGFSCEEIHNLYEIFIESMDDDFNMPKAFSVVFSLIRLVNEDAKKQKVFLVEAMQQFSNPKEQYINDLNLLKGLKIDVNRIEIDQHNHLQFPPHKTKQHYT